MLLETVSSLVASIGVKKAIEESIKNIISSAVCEITKGMKIYAKKKEFEQAIIDYIINSYEEHLYMNTIVFGNAKKTIFELYEPLTIVKDEFSQEITKKEKYVIDGDIDFVKKYKNILIEDTAGMGKSTIVKYLTIACLTEDGILPFVIELRNLKEETIINYIKAQIQSLSYELDTKDVAKFLENGKYIFLFDGYDEIEDKYKSQVAKQIKKFVATVNESFFIITSRKEDGLTAFGNFQKFSIQDLTIDEAYDLIKKYDNNGELSNVLIKKIKYERNLKNTRELLKNPLLVSLLYKTFEYGNEIPYKKTEFYALIFDALFDKHDKTKGNEYQHEKRSRLDSSEFNHILRAVGFVCLQNDTIEYSKNDLKDIINRVLEKMRWIKCGVDDIYYDLTHVVPYFQEYNQKIKWVHKSFMEYFAANYIYLDKTDKKSILKYMASNASKYSNVLDFYYDLDLKNFRRIIIQPILKSFTECCRKQFNNEYFSEIDDKEKQIRVSLSLMCDRFLLKDREISYDSVTRENNMFYILKKWNLNWGKSGGDIKSVIFGWKDYVYIVNKQEKETLINENILDFLKYKHVDIFIKKKINHNAELGFAIEDGVYELNENTYNPLNFKENFKKLNDFMCSKMLGPILDYDKALKLLNDIENESYEDVNNLFAL